MSKQKPKAKNDSQKSAGSLKEFTKMRTLENKLRRIYRSSGVIAAKKYAEKYNILGYFNSWDKEKTAEKEYLNLLLSQMTGE